MNKIILDLCGGTGAWSDPYKDAGYEVYVLTLPEYDVVEEAENLYLYPPATYLEYNKEMIDSSQIYGILAAPPCTMFSNARTIAKKHRDTEEAMKIVNACQRIIWWVQHGIKTGEKKTTLKFWALENPGMGVLDQFIGRPAFKFNPYDFGDDYKKLTYLWGNFNDPVKSPIETTKPKFDRLLTKEIAPEQYGKLTRKERRAITPPGFAKAFFEANQ